jgi:predicted transcriptional regulator
MCDLETDLAGSIRFGYRFGMTLKDWLAQTGTSYSAFAPRIGVANASVVQRYVEGRVPRSPNVRKAIVRETDGKVQLSDLYAVAAE